MQHTVVENISWIKKAITMADAKNVKTTVILNPSYPGLHFSFDEENYFKWRKIIASEIADVWDFASFSGEICNDANWYDVSHFTFSLGGVFLNIALDPNGKIARSYSQSLNSASLSENQTYSEEINCSFMNHE